MRIRSCPAAVSGNDRRHRHWDAMSWEATASRSMLVIPASAHEPEDLPLPPRVRGVWFMQSRGRTGFRSRVTDPSGRRRVAASRMGQ